MNVPPDVAYLLCTLGLNFSRWVGRRYIVSSGGQSKGKFIISVKQIVYTPARFINCIYLFSRITHGFAAPEYDPLNIISGLVHYVVW